MMQHFIRVHTLNLRWIFDIWEILETQDWKTDVVAIKNQHF